MVEVCHGTLSGFLLFLVDEPGGRGCVREGEGHREVTRRCRVVRPVLDFGLHIPHVLEEAGVSGSGKGKGGGSSGLDRDDAQDIAFVEVHHTGRFSFRCFSVCNCHRGGGISHSTGQVI